MCGAAPRKEQEMSAGLVVAVLLAVVVLVILAKTAVVVPQQSAYVVERLGKFSDTLNAGFHMLLPFLDVIRYRHSLKEQAIDIPEQTCITRDNVQVGVDGVLYLKVMEPDRASYGVTDYVFAISQLAQTTLRSEVGKIELDRTFEERTTINAAVVSELPGGYQAVQLRVGEQYLVQFGNLAKAANTLIVPATLSDVTGMIATALNIIRPGSMSGTLPTPPAPQP
jgi:regulator of protease activity HflC (stomatin/prohibitin superfamily)